jgi:hypothetical protein
MRRRHKILKLRGKSQVLKHVTGPTSLLWFSGAAQSLAQHAEHQTSSWEIKENSHLWDSEGQVLSRRQMPQMDVQGSWGLLDFPILHVLFAHNPQTQSSRITQWRISYMWT